MKPKSSLSSLLVLSLALFFILGCQLSSQAAPSDPAFTSMPASTPTPAVPPSPTPRPDISSAVLRLEDLPAGFEEFSMEEMGMTSADFENDVFQPEHVFAFLNTQNIQMVFGFNFMLTEKLDRTSFDLAVSQPDMAIPAFVEGMGSENVRDEKLLEGMEDIGEKRIGMTMVATMEGIPMQVDVVMFRTDVIGAMIMSMYLEGQEPNITAHDLALKMDQRIQEALQTIK